MSQTVEVLKNMRTDFVNVDIEFGNTWIYLKNVCINPDRVSLTNVVKLWFRKKFTEFRPPWLLLFSGVKYGVKLCKVLCADSLAKYSQKSFPIGCIYILQLWY